jgi:hypothetical protein
MGTGSPLLGFSRSSIAQLNRSHPYSSRWATVAFYVEQNTPPSSSARSRKSTSQAGNVNVSRPSTDEYRDHRLNQPWHRRACAALSSITRASIRVKSLPAQAPGHGHLMDSLRCDTRCAHPGHQFAAILEKNLYAASVFRWCRGLHTMLCRPGTRNVPLQRARVARVAIPNASVLPQSGIGPLAIADPIPVLR